MNLVYNSVFVALLFFGEMMMKKPEIFYSQNCKVYDFNEVVNYISEKYGFNGYDVYDASEHFNKWFKKKHHRFLNVRDKENYNVFLEEYKKDEEGQIKCPKLITIFDWLMEKSYKKEVNHFEIKFEDLNSSESPDYIKDFAYFFFAEFEDKTELIVSNN